MQAFDEDPEPEPEDWGKGGNTAEGWEKVERERDMERAWQESGSASKHLTEITDFVTRIDDERLQNSNFMKFMKQINKGQVSFQDNQVFYFEISSIKFVDKFVRIVM